VVRGFEYEYPLYQHSEVARHPVDASEDASAFRTMGLDHITTPDPAIAALVVTGVGFTDPETTRVGYSVGWGFRAPHGYDHLQAMLGVIPEVAKRLPMRFRMRLALAIITGKRVLDEEAPPKQLAMAAPRQGRPDARHDPSDARP
jgi:hypothetical protein